MLTGGLERFEKGGGQELVGMTRDAREQGTKTPWVFDPGRGSLCMVRLEIRICACQQFAIGWVMIRTSIRWHPVSQEHHAFFRGEPGEMAA